MGVAVAPPSHRRVGCGTSSGLGFKHRGSGERQGPLRVPPACARTFIAPRGRRLAHTALSGAVALTGYTFRHGSAWHRRNDGTASAARRWALQEQGTKGESTEPNLSPPKFCSRVLRLCSWHTVPPHVRSAAPVASFPAGVGGHGISVALGTAPAGFGSEAFSLRWRRLDVVPPAGAFAALADQRLRGRGLPRVLRGVPTDAETWDGCLPMGCEDNVPTAAGPPPAASQAG